MVGRDTVASSELTLKRASPFRRVLMYEPLAARGIPTSVVAASKKMRVAVTLKCYHFGDFGDLRVYGVECQLSPCH